MNKRILTVLLMALITVGLIASQMAVIGEVFSESW